MLALYSLSGDMYSTWAITRHGTRVLCLPSSPHDLCKRTVINTQKDCGTDPESSCFCYRRVEVIPGKDGAPDVRIGCGEGCLNRLSYIHCDPRTCPCGTECSNRPFHLVKMPKMEVFLTDNRGHGVRATANMQRGSFVVEYAGEVSCSCSFMLMCHGAFAFSKTCVYRHSSSAARAP